MFNTNLKMAWRTLRKHPGVTAIHLLGLTSGITVCLLIVLFLRNEWSYDRHQPQGNRTFRVNIIEHQENKTEHSGITPYPMGEALRTDFPDWPVIASIHTEKDAFVTIAPEKMLHEERAVFAEPQFLKLFAVRLLSGNAVKALGEPNQAILSRSTALRYFGTTNVIGRAFRLGEKTQLQVAGVMEDLSSQTNLPANLLVSYKTLKDYFELELDQWGFSSQGSIFIRLPEGGRPEDYTARMSQFVNKYMKPDATEKRVAYLQPLHAIHFETLAAGTNFVPAISPVYLWTFGMVGLFVLLIACVNFINLSTARALIRAKEVGIRKTVGATGRQLIGQFLGEAAWLACLAAVIALAAAYMLLPWLNTFLGRRIAFEWGEAVALVIVLALLTTFAAGLYPALFMTRFNPVKVLYARVQTSDRGQSWLRQGLVVFQFTVSLVLAIGAVVVYQQMKLFREKDLGFQHKNVLTAAVTSEAARRPAFRDALLQVPGVENVSFALGAPTSDDNFNTRLVPNLTIRDRWVDANIKIADAAYAQTYGLKLLAGRFLQPGDTLNNRPGIPFDQRKYVFVVNEATVQAMGYRQPDEAIGKKIQIGINDIEAEIVGVVSNFHVSSLHEVLKPVVILNFPYFYGSMHLKLHPTNYQATLAAIERVWKQFNSNKLYDPQFLDDSLHELYAEESRQFTLLRLFTLVALIICCLGLWGLSTFLIQRRVKEIGIRKVLGASVASIVTLLSKDFLKLVLIAILIACPIGWYAMHRWLQDFAFRINIEWWVFALAGMLALGIALLTVSFKSLKAASSNPVKSLRIE